MFSQLIYFLFFVNVILSLECNTAWPANCIYNSTCSFKTKECHSNLSTNIRGGIYCYTLIQKVNDEILVGNMDCMYDQETTKICKNQTECIAKYTKPNGSFLHCCCDQQFCNLNFTLSNSSEIPPISLGSSCEYLMCKSTYTILFVSIIGIILLIFVFCFIYGNKLWRSKDKICKRLFDKRSQPEIEDPSKEKLLNDSSNEKLIPFNNLIIEHFIKRGRFASIHQGRFNQTKVAIKILSNLNLNGEENSLFENERSIYSLPFMEHQNILKYYGYSMNLNNGYLIFEYSCNGSLRDVLRSRLLVDKNELLLICKQISSGVEYLHHDYRDRNNNCKNGRPPIAHRDLKCENILYLNENRIVICDFAMSIKLDQNQNYPNEQQQIGTPRYMSPEILAGSIGYETNALLKCDVYALGIIFWEILSRLPTEDSNGSYEMPYEYQLRSNDLNLNPTINEMLQIMNLSIPLNRPLIRSSWKNSSQEYLNEICSTMEQCWDQNPDGRINAALVALRMNQF